MNKSEAMHELREAMQDFCKAYEQLRLVCDNYEATTGESVNDLKAFSEFYPFDCALEDLTIQRWVGYFECNIKQSSFKILNYEYLNTGGNTMVGVFTVWLPALKQTVYALTNEVGCTLSTVDYISNDIEIDNYDDVTIDACNFESLCPAATHFELYRHCYNEFIKSDCRYFGITYPVPYDLLSDELQSEVHSEYLEWCKENNGGAIPTDGVQIIAHPDFDALFSDPHDDNDTLNDIKVFKKFHDSIAGDVMYYEEEYILTFAGRTIRLPFMADVWDAIDNALQTTIENW